MFDFEDIWGKWGKTDCVVYLFELWFLKQETWARVLVKLRFLCQVAVIRQDLNLILCHIVDAGIQIQHPNTSGL